jgi:hypothetical protein
MIKKLHNHDWVRQGKQYYEQNYDEKNQSYICPFVNNQHQVILKKLEDYFDETYENQIKKLKDLKENYSNISIELENYFKSLLSTQGNKYFDNIKREIERQIYIITNTINNICI